MDLIVARHGDAPIRGAIPRRRWA